MNKPLISKIQSEAAYNLYWKCRKQLGDEAYNKCNIFSNRFILNNEDIRDILNIELENEKSN